MYLLIVYDIPEDKRRLKIDKALSAYGVRVNLSVFEVTVKSEAKYKLLVDSLNTLMNMQEDSIRIYPLNKLTVLNALELGERRQPFIKESGYVF